MQAEKISLEKAKADKLFYFVANVVVYRESDGRCLLLKRSDTEKVHPGKYAVPGGKLEWSDFDINNPTRQNGDVLDFQDALEKMLKREVYEEAGIQIDDEFKYINSVAYIRPDGVPTMLVKFAAKYTSGDVKLEQGSFSGFIWANEEEATDLPCILGIQEELAKTVNLFKK